MEFNTKSTTGKAVGRVLKNQAISAAKSSTGRAIGEALKNHAISTGTNLLADVVAGNNLNEGINREVGNIRQNAALGIKQLAKTNKHYESDADEIETNKNIQPRKKKNMNVQNSKKKKTTGIKKPVGKWVWFEGDSD